MAGSKSRCLFEKLVYLARSVSFYLGLLCGFVSSYIFRLEVDSSDSLLNRDEKFNIVQPYHVFEEAHVAQFRHTDEGEEKAEGYLKFKFPSYEEFRQAQEKRGNESKIDHSEVVPSGIDGPHEFPYGGSCTPASTDDLETFPADEINDDGVRNSETGEGIDEWEIEGIGLAEKDDHEEEFVDESQFLAEDRSVSFGCDSDLENLSNSYGDGFLSDLDFEGEMEINGQDLKMESDDESKNNEFPQVLNSDFLFEQDLFEDEYSEKIHDVMKSDDSEGDADSEDSDSLWEHQELIEQLKMELRKVRATGLPTILEESEASPKIMMADLKPWKTDEFRRDDCMGELQNLYKSYRERMRKFDIVSFQKMYAMGCLQMKDPLQSFSSQTSSSPTFKSLLSQNLRLFRNKIHGTESDPVKKFIKELQDDLEAVYVAHMCLSWEFLQWQYEKALDLWEYSDPRGARTYNEVADEFQQFQVLMQRFIEDEPFQGPRTQQYVNSRRIHRNLLQVPVIRQDSLKDRRKNRKGYRDDEHVITSEMLVEILEESIRIFWRFVRADKDCTTPASNGHNELPERLSSPEDLKLLMEAKKALEKKERKLGDLMRRENCILRKFRRGRGDDDCDQVLWFFSQVDMKLVGRTLNMSKVTSGQLRWCHEKLDRIRFVDRRIYVEPGFLLFPC